MRVAIVAGEQSGDQLGGGLLESLCRSTPDLQAEGIAGPLMQRAGCRSRYPMERLSVMGLVEVLGRLAELAAIRRTLAREWTRNPPDVFVGIDAPDFNFSLERRLKKRGIPVVHYVSPSVWAWRRYRLRRIARSVDLMLTLFPFEAEFYERVGIPVRYVGHPLADRIPLRVDPRDARAMLGLRPGGRVIAILPGSRVGEAERLAGPFLQAAAWCLGHDPDLVFVMPAANAGVRTVLERHLADHPQLPVEVLDGQAGSAMAAADALLVASGTATLEGLLYKRPMVVAYRLAAPSYWLVSRMLSTDWYSLPNLLAGEAVVPEITQHDVNGERLGRELLGLLEDKPRVLEMQEKFRAIHEVLRCGASDRAAQAIREVAAR